MIKVISETKRPIKIWASDLESEAEQQFRNLAQLPFIFNHVAVMPDAHAGRGSAVGTVIATQGAIIPAAVGVDIGCGMYAVKLKFKAEDIKNISELRHSIERSIPLGQNVNKDTTERTGQAFAGLGSISKTAQEKVREKNLVNASRAIGTLGGGNHFIEICGDQEGTAWVMLHSGSRNIGKCLAEIHIDKAKGLMKEYFIDLPDPDLSYLAQNTQEFKEYLHDLMWAQRFAMENRKEMMARIIKDLSYHIYKEEKPFDEISDFQVHCHHNYTSIENHFGKNVYITRKGAVSAKDGEFGIIPGSMGTKSYIVKGKGNPDSFNSCSHGAGRRMSRSQARKQFTQEDLIKQTEGVECRKDLDVIDEIPGSYKDIDVVMKNQEDLVDIAYELKQIMCVKG